MPRGNKLPLVPGFLIDSDAANLPDRVSLARPRRISPSLILNVKSDS